jgi:hypothetical protein
MDARTTTKTPRGSVISGTDPPPACDSASGSELAKFSERRKTCAVIEAYSRHDEVYLTTVHLLQRLGYDVRVFNTWQNRAKNCFVHAPSVRPRIDSAMRTRDVLAQAEEGTFDLVIFNTLEGAEVMASAKRIRRKSPVLGFLHNGSFVRSKPEYLDVLKDPGCRLMVLAPYIADQFPSTVTAGFMYPVFFHDREVPKIAPIAGRRRFCVQGYFDPKRRHYGVLLDAVRALCDEGRTDFEVWVMGRSFATEFRAFHRRVKQMGLAPVVHFTWKGVGYKSYYRILNSVDFILPLISPDSHPSYFLSKSTSSIAAAVGFGKIPIVHRRLADLYGITDVCFAYDGNLVDVMRDALNSQEQVVRALRSEVLSTRRRFLEQSERQLAAAIDAVTGYTRSTASAIALDLNG